MRQLSRVESIIFLVGGLLMVIGAGTSLLAWLLSDVLFLVSALLMFASQRNIFGLDYITYLQYVYQKWVVTLLIAAILQLYSFHRIGQELAKE